MYTKIGELSFEENMIEEGSWGQRDIGRHAATMTLYRDVTASYYIQWDIPSLESSVYIGLVFADRTLVDYDGLMSLPRQAVQLLQMHDFLVPADVQGDNPLIWFPYLSQIGRALEAWIPVRDLIADMAAQIQFDRDSFVRSYCVSVKFGQPYDIFTADADERANLDEMLALLDATDDLLATDYARPTINDCFGDPEPETASS